MKHQSKNSLKQTDLLIAESVIKNLIKQDRIKEAIDICEKKNISSQRFGELVKELK
jgi:hypothetical protein